MPGPYGLSELIFGFRCTITKPCRTLKLVLLSIIKQMALSAMNYLINIARLLWFIMVAFCIVSLVHFYISVPVMVHVCNLFGMFTGRRCLCLQSFRHIGLPVLNVYDILHTVVVYIFVVYWCVRGDPCWQYLNILYFTFKFSLFVFVSEPVNVYWPGPVNIMLSSGFCPNPFLALDIQ